MKRCPKCNSPFLDTEQFCEVDGSVLVTVARPKDNSLLIVVIVLGLIIGVLLFLGYFLLTRSKQPREEQLATSTSSTTQQQVPPRPVQAAPVPSESPTEEPSPSPSPSESPSPSPQSNPQRVELSSNPISTASGTRGKTGPVTISLVDGVTIDADEAWQTGEGIWYRRRGVVTLLDPKKVKTIERTATASPSPSPSPK